MGCLPILAVCLVLILQATTPSDAGYLDAYFGLECPYEYDDNFSDVNGTYRTSDPYLPKCDPFVRRYEDIQFIRNEYSYYLGTSEGVCSIPYDPVPLFNEVENTGVLNSQQLSPSRVTPYDRSSTRRGKRLVGNNAERAIYPSMAAVMMSPDNVIVCGGTILSEQLVLTSAACLWNLATTGVAVLQPHVTQKPTEVQQKLIDALNCSILDSNPNREFVFLEDTNEIRVGVGNSYTGNLTKFDVFAIETQYKPEEIENGRYGMAILVLTRPLTFSEHVQPASLPDPEDNYVPHQCTELGYGFMNEDEEYDYASKYLRKLQVPMDKEIDDCFNETQKDQLDRAERDQLICAGDSRPNDPHGACVGDVGGPLVCSNQETDFLLGVIKEFPEKYCSERKGPGLYHNVTDGLPWIRTIMEKFSLFGGEDLACTADAVIPWLSSDLVESCDSTEWMAYVYVYPDRFLGVGAIVHNWWILFSDDFNRGLDLNNEDLRVYFGKRSDMLSIEVQMVWQDQFNPGFSLLRLKRPLMYVEENVQPINLVPNTYHTRECSIVMFDNRRDQFHPSSDIYQTPCNIFDERGDQCVGDMDDFLKDNIKSLTPGPVFCRYDDGLYLRALNTPNRPKCSVKEEDLGRGPQLWCSVTPAITLQSWIAATVFPFECSAQEVVLDHGRIFTPGYPTNMRSNLNCEHWIEVPEGKNIAVHISDGEQLDCPNDYVLLSGENTTNTYCGGHFYRVFQGNSLYIRIHTDEVGASPRVMIEFEATEAHVHEYQTSVYIHQIEPSDEKVADAKPWQNRIFEKNPLDNIHGVGYHVDHHNPYSHDELKK